MKRLILSVIVTTALCGTISSEAFSAPLDCREILRRCANDCREVFDLDILKDSCVFGCFIGYVYCE